MAESEALQESDQNESLSANKEPLDTTAPIVQEEEKVPPPATTEEVAPTSSAEEQAAPISSTSLEETAPISQEEVPPPATKEEVGPTSPAKEQAAPTSPTKEQTTPTSPTSPGTTAPITQDEEKVPPPMKEEVAPTSPAKEQAVPTSPTKEQAAPTSPTSPKKNLSLLGENLTQRPASRHDRQPNEKDVSKEIARRYAHEVREADRIRKISYLPMEKQIDYNPPGHDVAKEMQNDLNALAKSYGGAHAISNGPGWDVLLGNDSFQKRMQFLHEHSRTGTDIIEQYGTDGEFEGDFLHGMRHGKGTYTFRQEVYKGEWKWDQRHGQGEQKNADGTMIKGEWQNGKPHGHASIIDEKGTVLYEGQFQNGKRHGLGRQIFGNLDMYDGGWNEGRLHDRGVYYFSDATKLQGTWKDGLYHGVGIFYYADGSISRREYKDGLLVSVQDMDRNSSKYGKTVKKDDMQKHTRDQDFPRDVFMLNSQ